MAMRPTDVRFAIGPNWRRSAALRADVSDEEIDAFVAAGFAERPERTESEFAALRSLRDAQIDLHLVIWEPPRFPREGSAPTKRAMQPADVILAARFTVALLKEIAARGVSLQSAELSNEPDGDWNITIAPATYLQLVLAVRQEAKRRNVTLPQIYGPGTSTIKKLREFLRDGAVAKKIVNAVDVLSVHAWDNPQHSDRFGELYSLHDDLAKLGSNPELAVTEFGLAKPDPADLSDRMNVKKRTRNGISETQPYATLVTRDLLRLYAAGVGRVMYWELQDQAWGTASFGLLDEKGNERLLYGMMRDVSVRLAQERPGRFESVDRSLLFLSRMHGATSLWAINTTAQPINVPFARGYALAELRESSCGADGSITVSPWSLDVRKVTTP